MLLVLPQQGLDFREVPAPGGKELEPEEIAARLRQQQMESEKDAQWLHSEERNLVCFCCQNFIL